MWAGVVQASVLEAISTADANTKIKRHTDTTLNSNWLKYDFDDSSWSIPSQVWSSGWWVNTGWRPAPSDLNPPYSPATNWYTMATDGATNPKVIQSTSQAIAPQMTREFVRKKFSVPANAVISNAYLY